MTARRLVLAVIATLALLAVPVTIPAQQDRIQRVGVIHQGGASYEQALKGLRDGLKELGVDEGKHFVFHVRDAKGDLKGAEEAARNLEAEKVDLIVAFSTSTALATKRATKSAPIVFYAGADPVTVGLVESIAKPGGRLTGVYGRTVELTSKRFELLKEMVPRLHRVITFYNPENSTSVQSLKDAREAARQLKVELVEKRVTSADDLRAALRALRPGEVDAHFHVADSLLTRYADLVIEAAKAKKLPTIYQDREVVVRGALACYGLSYYAMGRLSAKYVQRVLQGARPADLPVEQLDRLDFVINLKTARAIGLTIPPPVLRRADEVIE
jgi:putative tryptophan/tyrosine transport system substrate-binding protein